MAGSGIDLNEVALGVEDEFRTVLGELLVAARRSGSVKATVTAPDLKALIVGALAMQACDAGVADRVNEMAIIGLRP